MNEPFTPAEAQNVFDYLIGEEGCLEDEASFKLYVYLSPEMPYGVAKGRTGTPDEWYPEYFYGWSEAEIREWVEDRTAGVPQGVM